MSKYWSPAILDLAPYVPGEQPKEGEFIKLNTNENPYPPSPRVMEALEAYPKERLRLYCDPDASDLKQALAGYHGLGTEQVFVGNGSDEVLALAFMAFFRQEKPILYPEFTYSFYPVYCNLFGIEYQTLPLDEDFCVNVEDYRLDNGGIVIANPNAPTGIALPLERLQSLLEHNRDSVVLIDEAYVDFGAESAASLIDRYDNLLVVQTFSKSRSLAGLRIGFALGSATLIAGLERVKNSFNSYPLDSLAIRAGVAAVEDQTYFEETRGQIIRSREQLSQQLLALGFEVLPSTTNFLFVRHSERDAAALYQALKREGVLVRHFGKPGIEQFLRITIGTDAELATLVSKLKGILEGA